MSTNGGDVYPEAGAPTQPAQERRQSDAATARLTEEVGQLREGIGILIGRVESMTQQYQTIAELQRRQQDVDGKAAEAVREAAAAIAETKRLDRTKVSTEDHQQQWEIEQRKLIRTRLSIRRQTYVIGAVFFIVSMTTLGITTYLLLHTIHEANATRQRVCQDRNAQLVQQSEDSRKYFAPKLLQEQHNPHADPVLVSILQALAAQKPILTDCIGSGSSHGKQ